ncbi:hypothetical protein EC973_005015, partial [Apophysomyces ossiformis]
HNDVYNANGDFDLDKFETVFSKYASSNDGGKKMDLVGIAQMTNDDIGLDPMGWTMAVIEWATVYFFVGQAGKFTKEDVRRVYDGTLFFHLRNLQEQSETSSSKTGLTGVIQQKRSIIPLQGMIETFKSKFPSLASEVESRFQELTSLVQHHAAQRWPSLVDSRATSKSFWTTDDAKPRSLFRKESEEKTDTPVVLFSEGLTGIAKPTEAGVPLAGVKGTETTITEENNDTVILAGIKGAQDKYETSNGGGGFTIAGVIYEETIHEEEIVIDDDDEEEDIQPEQSTSRRRQTRPTQYGELELTEDEEEVHVITGVKQEQAPVETIEITSDTSVPGLGDEDDMEDNQNNANREENNDMETRSESSSSSTHESPTLPTDQPQSKNVPVVPKEISPNAANWDMFNNVMAKED